MFGFGRKKALQGEAEEDGTERSDQYSDGEESGSDSDESAALSSAASDAGSDAGSTTDSSAAAAAASAATGKEIRALDRSKSKGNKKKGKGGEEKKRGGGSTAFYLTVRRAQRTAPKKSMFRNILKSHRVRVIPGRGSLCSKHAAGRGTVGFRFGLVFRLLAWRCSQ